MKEKDFEEKCPAILSVVKKEWIDLALNDYFNKGKEILYFSTDSINITSAGTLKDKSHYPGL